jgi:hypothetical protein
MPVTNLADPNHWKIDRRAHVLAKIIAADGKLSDQLSTREVAQLLGYSRIWLRTGRMNASRYGPPFVKDHKDRVTYRRGVLVAWLRSRAARRRP